MKPKSFLYSLLLTVILSWAACGLPDFVEVGNPFPFGYYDTIEDSNANPGYSRKLDPPG
ncbi:MAG: hypothetical protein U5Q03_06010 [Bacteroidota bacterium]|nr:hypothetical protein [Bacteroidota bacterium]